MSEGRHTLRHCLGPRRFLPPNPELLEALILGSQRLAKRLRSIRQFPHDISKWGIYNLSLDHLEGILFRYAYVLAWALHGRFPSLVDLVFVDYGGASGVMSLLARELGVGKVIYLDIYEGSARDAKAIAGCAGLDADEYLVGDIDTLVGFFQASGLHCDAICSYDVLEHIYDIKSHFQTVAGVRGPRLRLVMASGANERNPYIRAGIVRRQRIVEFQGRSPAAAARECDNMVAYAKVRATMIREIAPSMPEYTLQELVRRTRGLRREDILAAVKLQENTGKLPPEPRHPTNTCDPFTGYWEEHLMDPECLKKLLDGFGFDCRVFPGYWFPEPSRSWTKRLAGQIINALIDVAPFAQLHVAPFYTIFANRRAESAAVELKRTSS